MSGVMHPNGPEAPETYWLRRALVVGAFLILVIIVLLFVFNLSSPSGQAAPESTAAATPSPTRQQSTASTAPSKPSDSSTSSASSKPTDAASSAPAKKSDPADKQSDPTGKQSDPADKQSDPADKQSDPADKQSDPVDKQSDQPEDQDKAEKKPSDDAEDNPPRTSKKFIPACKPGELRATLKSKSHTVAVKESVEFELTLINGGDKPCRLDVGGKNFELKIYSGTDRIWSSDDCRAVEPKISQTVQPERAVLWTMTWNGKRSREGATCKSRPEIPRPGYYYATSQYRGADPVQFLLILK